MQLSNHSMIEKNKKNKFCIHMAVNGLKLYNIIFISHMRIFNYNRHSIQKRRGKTPGINSILITSPK